MGSTRTRRVRGGSCWSRRWGSGGAPRRPGPGVMTPSWPGWPCCSLTECCTPGRPCPRSVTLRPGWRPRTGWWCRPPVSGRLCVTGLGTWSHRPTGRRMPLWPARADQAQHPWGGAAAPPPTPERKQNKMSTPTTTPFDPPVWLSQARSLVAEHEADADRYMLGLADDGAPAWWRPSIDGPMEFVAGTGAGGTTALRALALQAV